jgi:hypothetical protein
MGKKAGAEKKLYLFKDFLGKYKLILEKRDSCGPKNILAASPGSWLPHARLKTLLASELSWHFQLVSISVPFVSTMLGSLAKIAW